MPNLNLRPTLKPIESWVQLDWIAVQTVVDALPAELVVALKEDPHYHQAVIAGGFIRDTLRGAKPIDIDVFPRMGTSVSKLKCPRCDERCDNLDTSLLDPNIPASYAITLAQSCFDDPKVQLVQRNEFRGYSVLDVIQKFDVTVNAAGIRWHQQEWEGYCHEDFMTDLAARKIRILNKWAFPPARVRRFQDAGFDVPDELVMQAVKQVMEGVDQHQLNYAL